MSSPVMCGCSGYGDEAFVLSTFAHFALIIHTTLHVGFARISAATCTLKDNVIAGLVICSKFQLLSEEQTTRSCIILYRMARFRSDHGGGTGDHPTASLRKYSVTAFEMKNTCSVDRHSDINVLSDDIIMTSFLLRVTSYARFGVPKHQVKPQSCSAQLLS